MNDTPIDILRRISERKRAFREYEINELNELTKTLKSGSQPTDGVSDEPAGADKITPSAATPEAPAEDGQPGQPTCEEGEIPPRGRSSHEHLRVVRDFGGLEAPPAPKASNQSCRKWTPSVISPPFSVARQPETESRASEATAASLEEWREGLARLDPDRPPRNVPGKRWEQFIIDALRLFHIGMIKAAAELGWPVFDLFGCDDTKRCARIDQMGLVWLVNGNPIVSISSSAAVIEMPTGSRQTYRRRLGNPGRVLPWDL